MFTNLKEQVYEVKLPTHRQGHKQGEQRFSMLPLQEGHCPHSRQANLNKEVTICFMCYFASCPNNNTLNVRISKKFSPIDPHHRDDHDGGEADQPGGHGH